MIIVVETTFIGRQSELASLEAAYAAPKSALIPIYGRRRVGKSELILHFLRGKGGVYFLGKKAPAELQIAEMLGEAAGALDQPLLAMISPNDWQAALEAVVGSWKGEGKLVLALDEFQWTAAASPELPSVLQHLWDREWKARGDVMVILCGSYIGFMEREVLGQKSPLFGRRTHQILLRPFGYREAGDFHPRYGTVDKARTYFLCGGVPYYLRFFSDRRSVEANVQATILHEHHALFREPDFLLREELREVEKYHAVLHAVAARSVTNKEISSHTGIEARNLTYYLQQLLELGYLRRRLPLDGGRANVRATRYDIDDPLLRFWFRFVFPSTSYLLHRGPQAVWRDRIRPQIDAYFGACFERLCREALPALYAREGIDASFEIGEYWDKNVQIDVVGVRQDGWTDLGECKWGTIRAPKRVETELARKEALFPNPRQATIGRRVFARKMPAARRGADGDTSWHDLADLYAAGDDVS